MPINNSPHGSLARPKDRGDGLADVLERVLDKGVVIAGDIAINLLDIELLTIRVRLLIASADKARELGIDWWEHDPHYSSRGTASSRDKGGPNKSIDDGNENRQLRDRIARLEERFEQLTALNVAEREDESTWTARPTT